MKTKFVNLTFLAVLLFLSPFTNAKGSLGEIFGSIIGHAVGKAAGKALINPQTIESALKKVADQVNDKMPMNLDQDTRIDNILA
jgi:hypothetical protein